MGSEIIVRCSVCQMHFCPNCEGAVCRCGEYICPECWSDLPACSECATPEQLAEVNKKLLGRKAAYDN